MRRRLQVLGEIARRHGLTAREWVSQAIRATKRRDVADDRSRKLAVVRAATRHSFPTAGIERMLEETERGYVAGHEEHPRSGTRPPPGWPSGHAAGTYEP